MVMENVLAFSSDSNTPVLRSIEILHQRLVRTTSLSSAGKVADDDVLTSHNVLGVICREVTNELPVIGKVVVLEATADSQEELVNECLELEEEDQQEDRNYPKRISEGDPYGSVLWPASWAVSNFVLSQPDLMKNLTSLSILELGSGTGLVSISIAMGGAKRVLATDYEPLALALTRYAADNLNNNNNNNNIQSKISSDKISLSSRIETKLLDLCNLVQQPLPLHGVDVVLAADIMYEPRTGEAMAHRVVEALRHNCRVIVGDSPGRPGRSVFLNTLKTLGVEGANFQEVTGYTCSRFRNDLICGKGSTSVSEIPQELSVALLDLKPTMLQ